MGRFSVEFVDERRRALQLFLTRLLEHPQLHNHPHVTLFLTGHDTALQVAKSGTGTIKPKTAAKSIMSFFRSASQTISDAV